MLSIVSPFLTTWVCSPPVATVVLPAGVEVFAAGGVRRGGGRRVRARARGRREPRPAQDEFCPVVLLLKPLLKPREVTAPAGAPVWPPSVVPLDGVVAVPVVVVVVGLTPVPGLEAGLAPGFVRGSCCRQGCRLPGSCRYR
jgi:hypothetical protein